MSGRLVSADRSARGTEPTSIQLVGISATELLIELSEPLAVGSTFVVAFAEDEVRLASPAQSTVRCTACLEHTAPSVHDSGTYRACLRPFVPLELRRVLGPGL